MISIIIPALNAAGTLDQCLEALDRQTVGRDCYEVIVVDDGSTDATALVARAHGARCLQIPHAGPAIARNRGVAQAQGSLVLFTDADCMPASDWVEQMRAAFADDEVMGARGVYRTRQRGLVPRFVQQEYQDKYDHTARQTAVDFIDTYSAGYRRAVFVENGGFEEAFPIPSVEDQELSFRLAAKGYRLTFATRAAVFHLHDATLGEYIRRKFWIGYWKAFLLRWHPEKTLADSHTPLTQRVQLVAFALVIGLGALGLLLKPVRLGIWWVAAVGLGVFFVSALPFVVKIVRRDAPVAVIAPAMLVCRAAALGAGLAAGLVGLSARPSPRRPAMSWSARAVKRAMDIIGAVLALVVSAPALLLLSVLIKLDSPGPVFFLQERVGVNGRKFRIVKLRSMVQGADKMVKPGVGPGAGGKRPEDPRVTRIGRFLRRWSLDEVPQFWNVLVGEMSLVGPRPEEAQVVAGYSDWHRRRLAVKPGLSGPMQVTGRGQLSLDERVRLELEYIEHYTLWKDLAILLRTIPVVIAGRGAY